jgi:hypothetical protein
MAKRASKSSTIASSGSRTHLASVPVGHRARFLDGSVVLVAAFINGSVFVRDNDGVGNGPYELPRDTVVVEVIAPETSYADRSVVEDPLA